MSNLNELKPIHTLNPFGKFCCTIGHLPSSYMLSLSYEEQLLWFCDFLEKTVIPAVNGNAEAVRELQDLFVELKSYVDDYFTNLNVQTEINNKLDTMATDGTLDEIINQNIFNELNQDLDNLEETMTDNFETTNQNVEQNTTDIVNLTKAQNPISLYKGKNLVVFGDSFTDPENQNSVNGHWVNRVCQATGMNAFNFAKGAASIMRPYNSFRMQLNRALQMTDEQKQNTSVVIMYVPDTDIIENINLNDYYTEVDSLLELIVQNFPNAKIIFAGFTWRVNYLYDEYNNKMNQILFNVERNSSKYPVVILKNCRFWLLGLTGYYQNQYHPNEAGYNVIAQYFINAIYGGTNDTYRDTFITDLNLPNLTDDNYCEFEVINGQVSLKMFLAFDTDITNYHEKILNIPTIAIPHHDIMIPLLRANGTLCGTLRLTTGDNGSAVVDISSLPANQNAFLAPNSYRTGACRDF